MVVDAATKRQRSELHHLPPKRVVIGVPLVIGFARRFAPNAKHVFMAGAAPSAPGRAGWVKSMQENVV